MLSLVLIIFEQILKHFIIQNKPQLVLIKDWFEITYAENTGTVFGIAQGSNLIFIIFSFIILAALLFMIFENEKKAKYSFKQKLLKIILAGGISNLIDRVCRGFVVDYIYVRYFGVCNIADFCIVIGVVLLLFQEIKIIKK